MSDFESLDIKQIEASIIKGAKYLLQSVNVDSGIKDEDEKSNYSGIWVTAEALEFFFTTRILPIVSYSKIEPILKFLLTQQNRNNGSYTILSQNAKQKQEASTVSTGHCVYVLKLAVCGNFLNDSLKQKVLKAIEKGEQWLHSCCIEKDGYAFWGTKEIESCDPYIDERSRIEYIFDTYYSIMGLVSPLNYGGNSQINKDLIHKTKCFFREQADWFLKKYLTIFSDDSENNELPNVAIVSTFCRFVNVSNYLGESVFDDDVAEKIKQVISMHLSNPFSTTRIQVDNHENGDRGLTYVNNTPFDIGMALINTQTNINTIQRIIRKYLKMQNSVEGYWYLNFDNSYKIKTWSTTEALLVLDKAACLYKFLKLEEQQRINEAKCNEVKLEVNKEKEKLKIKEDNLNKENKKLRVILLISVIFSIVFALGVCIGIAYYISLPENKEKTISGILGYIFFPALFSVISQIVAIAIDFFNRQNMKVQNNSNTIKI